MPATYSVCIDWDGDGTFAAVGDDVSKRILARSNLVVQYGRDQARSLAPMAPGKAEFELNNSTRDYSPENALSPLAGRILPARGVRIQATLIGNMYTMFRGRIDEYDVLPAIETKSVRITALDPMAQFKNSQVSVDLLFSVTTGQAINAVLDALGWPAADRDIDRGATMIRWYWEENTDGLAALQRIVASEGPGAFVYIDDNNKVVFRDRHHRLTRTASTTSQATFRGSGQEPVMSPPLVYDHGWRDIINSITVAVDERDPASELAEVFTSDRTYSIADGQTLSVRAVASDPFFAAVTPVSGTDYTLASGAVTVTLSRTSGQSTTVFIKATGGPAVLTSLKVRAYPVRVVRTLQVQAEDSTSIGKYGRRAPSLDMPWAGVNDAQSIAEIILAQRAERLPIVTITVGGTDTRLTQQLTRRLSDRITIIDTETGLSAPFYIDRVEHRVIEGGESHVTVFGCEKVPTQPANVFILGSATRGVLGTNKLGKDGLDDPANLFILGSATNGVLGTSLLAH